MSDWHLPPHLTTPTIMSLSEALALPWHISEYEIDKKVWPIADGGGMVLGIVDTGVSAYHSTKGGLAGAILDARDFSGSRFGWEDHHGHGTHVAGIAGARKFGVAPKCQLVIGKALSENGAGSDTSVAGAIDYCAKKGAKVINLSLGSDVESPLIVGKIKELAQQGIIVVAAAGNSGDKVNSPASSPYAICDAAIDQHGVVAPFSCHGPQVDVCAPGVDILSLGLGLSMVLMSGTSMSSPWVSGILTCYLGWQKSRSIPMLSSVDAAIEWLTTASQDLGNPGADEFYGVGLPDADKMFSGNGTAPVPPANRAVPKLISVAMNDGTVYEFVRK